MEGVMMRGVGKAAMAVRKPDGQIEVETWELKPLRWYRKTPFVRGIFNFIDMLKEGYKCLMRSAELAGMEDIDEPSPFEQKLMDRFGDKLSGLFTGLSLVLGVALAIGLFIIIPTSLGALFNFAAKSVSGASLSPFALSLVEGAAKVVIFIAYLALVSLMKDMRRLFAYHGAEHKSIACYEAGEELTVENVRKYTRFHPRCGTSFLFIVLIISIVVFSVVTLQNTALRMVLKLVMLPVVVGISYEIIRLAGRYDNWLTRLVSAPGLMLQRLTTREPDDSQIEVGIASLKPVLPCEGENDNW